MEKSKDKTVIITGISKGLGKEICLKLLQENYHVIGISRTYNGIFSEFKKFRFLEYDLSDIDNLELFLKNNIKNKTSLLGFVNNAAIAYDDIITNMKIEKVKQMFNVNVFSPYIITKFVLRNMLLNKVKGSIVHLSSISVHTGYNGLSMYASSKGALEAFSKNTAREWGRRGIRSNCIVAGFMETEMSNTLDSSQKNRIYQRTSLKKPTSKESVSNMISFLLSNKSESITGQNIHVDSGTI